LFNRSFFKKFYGGYFKEKSFNRLHKKIFKKSHSRFYSQAFLLFLERILCNFLYRVRLVSNVKYLRFLSLHKHMYVNGLRVLGYKYKIKPLDFVKVIFIDSQKAIKNNKKFIANILINKSIKKYLKTVVEYKMRPAFGANVLLHIASLRRKYNFFNLFLNGLLTGYGYTFSENFLHRSIFRIHKNLKIKYLTVFSLYLRYYVNRVLYIYMSNDMMIQNKQETKVYFIQILIPFYRSLILNFFNKKGLHYKKCFLMQNSILVHKINKILLKSCKNLNSFSYKVNQFSIQDKKSIFTLYERMFVYIYLLLGKG
jgi:ribosomal protein S4